MSFYKEVPGLEKTLESTLKFDTAPTAGSTNPVTSDGVKDAIDGAVGDVAENLQQQIDGIAERAGSGYTPKGESTVANLNALTGQENGWLYTLTDAGTLTDGSLAVVAGDTVAWDATNEVWYKAMDYAPRQYGTNEVHNLATSATEADLVSGNYFAIDVPGAGGATKKLPGNLVAPKTIQDKIIVSLAPVFSETTNYKANECVMYGGLIHRFTADHPAGPWIGTDATVSNVSLNFTHRSRDYVSYLADTKILMSKDGIYTSSYDGKILTERLNGLRRELPVTIISEELGYYMNTSGVKNSNATFSLRTIDVTGVDSVYCKCYTGSSVSQLVFQDVNNQNVGVNFVPLSSGYNEFDVDVPPTATKALISHSIINERTCDVYAFKIVPDFMTYDEKYDEYKYVDVDWSESGAYLFSDGTLSTVGGANWKNSGKLPIEGAEKIRITNRISSGILYAKFLDENDVEILPRQGGTDNSNKLLVVNVPPTAKSVILSVIDYVTSPYHTIEFAYKQKNKKTDNNGLNDCFAKNLADVTMIPIFGQSLSRGSDAKPPITVKPTYKAGIQFNTGLHAAQQNVDYFKEFMPLFETETGSYGETMSSGCCDEILELIQKEDGISVHSELWGEKKILFVTCGAGSMTIANLISNYLTGLENAIQGAKNICDANNKTFAVPCWIWCQGETDQKLETTKTDYKNDLLSLQASIVSSVLSITGQTNAPLCLLSQCNAQNIVLPAQITHPFSATALDVPTAQMELARDNDEFVLAVANYCLDHNASVHIHLSNFGSRMMGLYFGVVAKYALEGIANNSLVPTSASVSGNDITLSVRVPVPPLVVDESWVYAVANNGFAVVNSSDVDILTSVDVKSDKIILHCSASPSGCKLFYGLNGTANYDGREQGSRGNIRDCAGFINSGTIAGQKVCLHNYLPAFVMDIS